MRITPNHPRLRLVALSCWTIGSWCVVQGSQLALTTSAHALFILSIELLELLMVAIGIAFWQIGVDKRAGVVFDEKGLVLNLGHSSSFIAWQNIERAGVSYHRASVLAIGSRRQVGICLRDINAYVQSYEERLPATQGPLARALRLIQSLLRSYRHADASLVVRFAHYRAVTGYDVLIPEALIGGKAETFVELLDRYRLRQAERQTLSNFYPRR
jgi:hypothetical protein